jgi:hypothetical protein
MTTVPGRRRLTQRGAALALAAGLLAVPGIPLVLDAVLPTRVWETITAADEDVSVSTKTANFPIAIPAGWTARPIGSGAVLRNGSSRVLFQAYDVGDRDIDVVQQRIMRATRIGGITTAFDGGDIATADGGLRGRTCVAIADDSTGPCAYLTDGDVVVMVTSLGTPEAPAAPLDAFVAPLVKEQQS